MRAGKSASSAGTAVSVVRASAARTVFFMPEALVYIVTKV